MADKQPKSYRFSQRGELQDGESAVISSRSGGPVDFAITPEYQRSPGGKALDGRRVRVTADMGTPVALRRRQKTDSPTVETGINRTETGGVDAKIPFVGRVGTNDAFRVTVDNSEQVSDHSTVLSVESNQGIGWKTVPSTDADKELAQAQQKRRKSKNP